MQAWKHGRGKGQPLQRKKVEECLQLRPRINKPHSGLGGGRRHVSLLKLERARGKDSGSPTRKLRPLGAPCHPQNTSPRSRPLASWPEPHSFLHPGLSFPAGLGRRSELRAFAFAVPCQVFPLPALPRKQRTALVVCGPEQNGAVGLACARHLRVFVSSEDALGLPGSPPLPRSPENVACSSGQCPGGDRIHPVLASGSSCQAGSRGPVGSPGGSQCRPPSCFPQEYEPTIFYPTRSPDPLHRDLTIQCEKMDIPFLSYLPTEVSLGGSRGVVGDRAPRPP